MDTSLGPVAFARLLKADYGLAMSHQAVAKAPYLPRDKAGKIVVQDALICLAKRGRITIEGIDEEPEAAEPAANGRPRSKGSELYQEQAKTEVLRRRKLEMEIAELEGTMVAITDVTEALVTGARKFAERVKRITLYTDEITAAARTNDANGVREVLTRIARNLQEAIAEDLKITAAKEEDEEE